jgi:hypothetical protein
MPLKELEGVQVICTWVLEANIRLTKLSDLGNGLQYIDRPLTVLEVNFLSQYCKLASPKRCIADDAPIYSNTVSLGQAVWKRWQLSWAG